MNNILNRINKDLSDQYRQTKLPLMFYVEGRRRIYGLDVVLADKTTWVNVEEGAREVDPPEDGEETDFVIETGYVDVWETLAVSFTKEGCKEYLNLNGHNCRNYQETRIQSRMIFRCPEMLEIRRHLIGLNEKEVEKLK